jgi:hypothetical protein
MRKKGICLVLLLFFITGITIVSAQNNAKTPKLDKFVRDYVQLANDYVALEKRVERNPERVSKRELYRLQDRADAIAIEAEYMSTWGEVPTDVHEQKILDSMKKVQLATQKLVRYAERMAD